MAGSWEGIEVWEEHLPALVAWGQIQGCLRTGWDGHRQGIDWASAYALLKMHGTEITPPLTAGLVVIEQTVIHHLEAEAAGKQND